MIKDNIISHQIDEYLEYKRSLGYELKSYEVVINEFRKYTLENDFNDHLTRKVAYEWCCSGKNNSEKNSARRYEIISPFAKYVAQTDPDAESFPTNPFKNGHTRPIPHVFSENETLKIMQECRKLFSPDGLRAKTIECAIGLLWSTGMRPSECVNLTVQDINLKDCLISIKQTKFKKDRTIPISDSTKRNLEIYNSFIQEKVKERNTFSPFFITTNCKALSIRDFEYAFQCIREKIGLKGIGYKNVRLMDFRHTFASRTIANWLESGQDFNSKLQILSAYLGHVHPEDTYWYLSTTPKSMKLCAQKFEDKFGGKD